MKNLNKEFNKENKYPSEDFCRNNCGIYAKYEDIRTTMNTHPEYAENYEQGLKKFRQENCDDCLATLYRNFLIK